METLSFGRGAAGTHAPLKESVMRPAAKTDQTKQNVLDAIDAGLKAKAAAKAYGVSLVQALQWRRERGDKLTEAQQKLLEAEAEEAAPETPRSASIAATEPRRFFVEKYTPEQKNAALADIQAGMAVYAAAQKHGVAPQRMYSLLSAMRKKERKREQRVSIGTMKTAAAVADMLRVFDMATRQKILRLVQVELDEEVDDE
jgi:hypothetical protein